MYAATPISRGIRRPNRSDRGPAITWPMARPSRQAVMVSCAVDVELRSSAVSAGRTGKYRSMEIGPKDSQQAKDNCQWPSDCLFARGHRSVGHSHAASVQGVRGCRQFDGG